MGRHPQKFSLPIYISLFPRVLKHYNITLIVINLILQLCETLIFIRYYDFKNTLYFFSRLYLKNLDENKNFVSKMSETPKSKVV